LQRRIGDALGADRVRVAHEFVQRGRHDLPAQAEPVDEPAARLRLSAALEQRVPVAVQLGLVVAHHDHRDGVVELVVRPCGDRLEALAEQGEVHDLHGTRRPARRLAQQCGDAVHARVREDGRVEPGRLFRALGVPEVREDLRAHLRRHAVPPLVLGTCAAARSVCGGASRARGSRRECAPGGRARPLPRRTGRRRIDTGQRRKTAESEKTRRARSRPAGGTGAGGRRAGPGSEEALVPQGVPNATRAPTWKPRLGAGSKYRFPNALTVTDVLYSASKTLVTTANGASDTLPSLRRSSPARRSMTWYP